MRIACKTDFGIGAAGEAKRAVALAHAAMAHRLLAGCAGKQTDLAQTALRLSVAECGYLSGQAYTVAGGLFPK